MNVFFKHVDHHVYDRVRGPLCPLKKEENPKKVYAYINSKVKTRQGVGDICVDPDNPKSKVTDNDQEKANIFSKFFSSVQVEETGECPNIEKKKVKFEMPPLKIKKMRDKHSRKTQQTTANESNFELC